MTTPLGDIEKHLATGVEARMKAIVDTLRYVGEMCLAEARNGGTYCDRTGNLRSSIGYAIVRDGRIVDSGYGGKVKEGDEGASDGIAFLRKKAGESKRDGISLIVTAGMKYAEYVEAKGYVVLSRAEEVAPAMVKSLLAKLGFTLR